MRRHYELIKAWMVMRWELKMMRGNSDSILMNPDCNYLRAIYVYRSRAMVA